MKTIKTLTAAVAGLFLFAAGSAIAAPIVTKTKLNATEFSFDVFLDKDEIVVVDASGTAMGNGHGKVSMTLLINVDDAKVHQHSTEGQDGMISIAGKKMVQLKAGMHTIFVRLGNDNADPRTSNADVRGL